MRGTRCSVFTPYKEIAIVCKRNSLKKSANAQESCKVARFCAFTFCTTCDLALVVSPVGVLVFAPLRVLMFVLPPNSVNLMKRKKAARNKFSNFESILILIAMLHRVVFASFSRSSEKKEFCRPCSCRRLVRIFQVGLNSCLAFIGEVFCPYLPTFEGVCHCIGAPREQSRHIPQFSQELAAIDGLHELGDLFCGLSPRHTREPPTMQFASVCDPIWAQDVCVQRSTSLSCLLYQAVM